MYKSLIFNVLCFILGVGSIFAESPTVLYLTWIGDPSSSMVIQWHTNQEDRDCSIYYRKTGEEGWRKKEGDCDFLGKYSVLMHQSELIDLEEDTEYSFRVGNRPAVYRFRTMPKTLKRDVRFVVGGDVFTSENKYMRMNEVVSRTDPDFIVLGGDIAYTNSIRNVARGRNWETRRWHAFFEEWKKQMVTSDGRMIPILVVVGNHDIGRAAEERRPPELFYDLFAFPEKGKAYRTVDFGYLSLFLLDSGHSYPIEGRQTAWLQKALEDREEVLHKMAVYHIAAYPSVYSYKSAKSVLIRKNWVPLFEKYGVEVAFENHNHAYKRTHPIKNNQVDEEGVIYLGDGCWGVSPRKPFSEKDTWYLAKSKKANSIWLVTLSEEKALYEALDVRGELIEKIEIPNRKAPAEAGAGVTILP